MKTHTSSNHWSNYWKAGQLTSLPQDFKGNYNGSIKKEWNKCFNKLTNNCSILDLCAGNCAIGLLGAEFSKQRGKPFNITCVDAANVDKNLILSKYPKQKGFISQIKIMDNCKIEDMCLKDNQFDLITSQYGIEYCDWELASRQVYRLLKIGGEFTMICHSGSTEIIKLMEKEKNHYNFLFDIGLFGLLKKYGDSRVNYNNFVFDLKQIQKLISQYFYNNHSPLISTVLFILDNIINMQKNLLIENKHELTHLCNQHIHAFARLKDLFRVTNSIIENPDWFKIFVKQGLKLVQQKSILQKGGLNSGQLFCFKKLK